MQFPLRDLLTDITDEDAIMRIGERIHAGKRRSGSRRLLPLAVAGALAVAGLLALVPLHREAGPLLLADGHELGPVEAGAAALDLDLADGSRISLSPGARFEPLESSGRTFLAIVSQGRADFEVRPGGPRRWIVECGLATVEVVGTKFACAREPGRLRVEVNRGAVLVRGDLVPGRARRLFAGEAMALAEEAKPRADVPASVEKEGGAEAAGLGERGAGSGMRTRSAPIQDWRVLRQRGRQREAYAALGTLGFRRESRRLGVDDLLALADVARLSGHPAEAVLPLQRILSDFARDAQAPLAAFALGRLELDGLGHPQAAVSAFGRALALGIPSSLREDARARLVEADVRAGDTEAARRAGAAYLAEFPKGRHVHAVQTWLRLQQ
jgi:transmembrane sensor